MLESKKNNTSIDNKNESSSLKNNSYTQVGVRSLMSRRTPSILVTDSRNIQNRRNAPFAGHAAGLSSMNSKKFFTTSKTTKPKLASTRLEPSMSAPQHSPELPPSSNYSRIMKSHNDINAGLQNIRRASFGDGQNRVPRKLSYSNTKHRKRGSGQLNDISMDSILSDVSDIPSGRPEERLRLPYYGKMYSKFSNPRTSKTSEKLVLIPDDTVTNIGHVGKPVSSYFKKSASLELKKDFSEYARITAYNISDALNLTLLRSFLKKTHEVSPRLYDECLYAPYCLPLLTGKDGFRIRSNLSKTLKDGKTFIDKLIDTSEQRDHHYEYYSGIETVEDKNNNFAINDNNLSSDIKTNNHADVITPKNRALNNVEMAVKTPRDNDAFKKQSISNSNGDGSNINSNRNNTNSNSNSNNNSTTHKTPNSNNSIINSSNNSSNANNDGNTKQLPTSEFDPSEPQFFAEEDPDQDSLSFLAKTQSESPPVLTQSQQLEVELLKRRHAEVFIFNYGVVVFWNFTEDQEKNILADIQFSANYDRMVINPSDQKNIEIEEFAFEYDKNVERPRILNDVITLRSGDHIIKLTLSHAIAQSCKLSKFETRLLPILHTVTKLPRRLALYGRLGMTRQKLLKKFGKLFKLRVDVNLSSNILDTPEFFWSFEPSLDPLYSAMRDYLEIAERVQVLNDKCKVFLEFVDICVDSIAEKNMTRITWWFIVIIFVSVLVSILEILIRYLIIRTNKS
ncbi:related to Sporulation protein RMD8 [Saccharomycodes ludwigii]|uniref:Related to Sporulation protein RMD8 n=1 Tax=Saccharomycodes ludwigii TaxID=36035 RepID=A0A376B4H4_9ASCO|nr:related to Sporulation protein RMD8 [Saccharomycodes ludwigii]